MPKLLLIEDEQDVSTLLRLGLGALAPELELSLAVDGQEALALLRGGARFDLLLSDVMMPGLDGVRLAEALRGEPSPPRVLLLTAVGVDQLTDTLALPFVVGHLQKPIDLRLLVDEIRRHLAR